ncbi:MAG TPA: YkvA family protein [Gemmatimonadaceae bacterium]|jgi:uncharacterized membrane protein YkvA (DUF1232 family)|nr:YkvA family protein [Gemmatimonadaceae bacterium]
MTPREGKTEVRGSRGGRRRARSSPRLDDRFSEAEIEVPERPRTGAKRTVVDTIRQLPDYVRLLFGLLSDRRVSALDKVLVGAAVAYILAPVDFIPDFIPFLGEVDDVFLLVTALQRLIANAGRTVVTQYWAGNPADLKAMNLRQVLTAAAFFLPRRMRRRLRAIGRS